MDNIYVPRSTAPRMHSTLRTNHFFNSPWTAIASRNEDCFVAFVVFVTTCVLFGRGKKSTKSTTPSSWMYRVCRMFEEGRYCCLVVKALAAGGQMLKYPPLSLSSRRQKTEGESKSGLAKNQHVVQSCLRAPPRQELFDRTNKAYQHMKSMLPSMPTRAQVRMFPIKP